MTSLRGRSLLKPEDLTKEEFLSLVDLAAVLREEKSDRAERQRLRGRSIVLLFEKTSTRTRCAFEVAAYDQGAHVTFLGPEESQFGHKESAADTARVLGRMYDGIEFRGYAQATVETLAANAGVPVWNGLTDEWHPTQVLADVRTLRDHVAKPIEETALCYLGDGRNNTASTLLVAGALLGMDVRVAAPPTLQPTTEVWAIAERLASVSGARLMVTDDPVVAVKGTDALYTDVWVSMGEPEDRWEERLSLLTPYQVTSALMAASGNPQVKFLHCLPALHDRATTLGAAIEDRHHLDALEVTDEVFRSPASVVFDQAANRLHTIKALMVATIGD